jgi:hypothetical protein
MVVEFLAADKGPSPITSVSRPFGGRRVTFGPS